MCFDLFAIVFWSPEPFLKKGSGYLFFFSFLIPNIFLKIGERKPGERTSTIFIILKPLSCFLILYARLP
jgi:hypothetical protein